MVNSYYSDIIEAGCDEAGRGCLAGPVFAAAVVLPEGFYNPLLNDSKQLSAKNRYRLRTEIINNARAWAVATCSAQEIDQINILQASVLAMKRAVATLSLRPQHLIIDGNYFTPYEDIPHHCIVKGDALYASIAAASILAKTYRDDYMLWLDQIYPQYAWSKNKGYPTQAHRKAIAEYGISPWHRVTFSMQKS